MPPVPLRLVAALAAAALALALGACGASDSATVEGDAPVVIEMSEFRLSPQDLWVEPGARTLEIRNTGTIVHRFELRSADGTRRIALGAPLRPGAEERIELRLRAGEYVMRCAQDRHNTLGEHGVVHVG